MHQSTTLFLSQTIWARWASRKFLSLPVVQTLLPVAFGYSLSLEAVVMLWEPYPYHHNGLFSPLLVLEISLPEDRSISVLSDHYENSYLFNVTLSFLCNIICYLISVFAFSLVILFGATTRYETIDEMKEAVTKVIDTLTKEDFYGGFQKLLECKTSALQPEEITSKGTSVSCVNYQ